MLLYHGTAGVNLDTLLSEGLKPRGKRKGNWSHSSLSRKDAVYLSRAYAPYFAMMAAEARNASECLVVELDSNRIFPRLAPDEDFLEQVNRGRDTVPGNMHQRTRWYRDRLHKFDLDVWEGSVRGLGNCCHLGTIHPTAFTRVAVIDRVKNKRLGLQFDPSITLINYRIMGETYYWTTRWMFGDDRPTQECDDFRTHKIDCRDIIVWKIENGRRVGKPTTVNRDFEPSAHMRRILQMKHERPAPQSLEQQAEAHGTDDS